MSPSLYWLLVFAQLFVATVASAQVTNTFSTFFYVNSNVAPNAVIAYALNYDGSITNIATYPTGANGGNAALGVNGIVIGGPGSNCLYASNDGSNSITAFSLNPVDGTLSFTQTFPSGGTAGGGISLAATSDGAYLYVANQGSNSITGFQIDPNLIGGCNVAPLSGFPAPVFGPDSLKTTADAAYLFVASPFVGPHGLLYWFSIDPSSGQLLPGPGSPVSVRASGPDGLADGVDITCREDYVAVGETSGTSLLVDLFDFDSTTGSITTDSASPIMSNSGIDSLVVQFSADDSNLFVVGTISRNVSSFDTSTFEFQSATSVGIGGGNLPFDLATDGYGLFAVTANINSVSTYVRRLTGDLDEEAATTIPAPVAAESIAIWPPKCNN
jgi:lactonase family protein with 7-bladed beta-propeller